MDHRPSSPLHTPTSSPSQLYNPHARSRSSTGPSSNLPPTTTPSHPPPLDLGLGLSALQQGLAGLSPTSSLAPSRQPSSSGGGTAPAVVAGQGGPGTFTPDLSARINAMSLESKMRDIDG